MSCCNETKTNIAAEVVVPATTDAFSSLRNSIPLDDGVQRPFSRPAIHQDGSIEYPVTGDKPPAEINGYLRDATNKWLFRPTWVPCRLRMSGIKPNKKTGEINVVMVCNNPPAEQFHKFVTAPECATCPVRAMLPEKNQ